MTIHDFETNVRTAMRELAALREQLPSIAQVERNAVGNFMLLDKDGEYLGYVDPYRGEADKA